MSSTAKASAMLAIMSPSVLTKRDAKYHAKLRPPRRRRAHRPRPHGGSRITKACVEALTWTVPGVRGGRAAAWRQLRSPRRCGRWLAARPRGSPTSRCREERRARRRVAQAAYDLGAGGALPGDPVLVAAGAVARARAPRGSGSAWPSRRGSSPRSRPPARPRRAGRGGGTTRWRGSGPARGRPRRRSSPPRSAATGCAAAPGARSSAVGPRPRRRSRLVSVRHVTLQGSWGVSMPRPATVKHFLGGRVGGCQGQWLARRPLPLTTGPRGPRPDRPLIRP